MIIESDLNVNKRIIRWSFNFMSKDYANHNLLDVNKAAKVKKNDNKNWKYKYHEQIEMHENEKRKKEFTRMNKRATTCATIFFIFERRCVFQNDDSLKNESLEALYQVTADAIKTKRTKNLNSAEMLTIFTSSNIFVLDFTKNSKKFAKKSKKFKRENSSENSRQRRKKFRTAVIEISLNEKLAIMIVKNVYVKFRKTFQIFEKSCHGPGLQRKIWVWLWWIDDEELESTAMNVYMYWDLKFEFFLSFFLKKEDLKSQIEISQ